MIKVLHNEVKVYWDGENISLVDDGKVIQLDPQSQIELVAMFEDMVEGKIKT